MRKCCPVCCSYKAYEIHFLDFFNMLGQSFCAKVPSVNVAQHTLTEKKYLIVNHFISHFTFAEFSLDSICFCFLFLQWCMFECTYSVLSVCVYTAKWIVLWEQVFAAECRNWKWQCLSYDIKHSNYYYTVWF